MVYFYTLFTQSNKYLKILYFCSYTVYCNLIFAFKEPGDITDLFPHPSALPLIHVNKYPIQADILPGMAAILNRDSMSGHLFFLQVYPIILSDMLSIYGNLGILAYARNKVVWSFKAENPGIAKCTKNCRY